MAEAQSHAMIFKFILICFLLFEVRAENQSETILQKIDASHPCDFDGSRKNYDAFDLLQCFDELASDLVDRESGRQTSGRSQWNGSTGRQISLGDILAGFFDDDSPLTQQSIALPAHTSSQYQSSYPSISGGASSPSPGFQLNFFDALSSISRHDDYKCIPRILCEMASGKLPGRSSGKQTSGFFQFLGKNTFTEWLTNIDVAGASPLLNFGRAMILGYSNRGNSLACYEAFPKCPRDSNELVYYLNNYNGGFFRLFNRIQVGKYRQGGLPDNDLTVAQRKIITDPSHKPNLIGVIRNEIHFPDYERLRNEVASNGIQKHIDKSGSNIWGNHITFFPQEKRFQIPEPERYSRFRFP